jgi:alcohol dehydrogenase class IV
VSFTWHDAERVVRFGPGALEEAPELLREAGFDGHTLLTTERALEATPGLEAGAAAVVYVPAGKVDELAAGLLEEARDAPLVALGGGRVIDVAKALAGAGKDGRCAAIPTTLAGSPMTAIHRTPKGAKGAGLVRPQVVIADPALMASAPEPELAATAMNALAHSTESLYTPLANPVADLAALRAATLISEGLTGVEVIRPPLALGSILAGYAVGSAGLAVHHAVCQTIVRVTGSPHAQTNAVMLPHFARLMAYRAPAPLGKLAKALGDPVGDPGVAGALIAKLAARSGHTRLGTLGVEREQLPEVADAVQGHPGLNATPDPPTRDELLQLLEAAV